MNANGAYIHIPFCRRRCGYCDFNTFAGLSYLIPDYVKALCDEINFVRQQFQDPPVIDTLFFGGGTPSLLKIDHFERILDCLRNSYLILPEAEITIEANPGTVTKEYIASLATLGINRISFGMQSANVLDLKMLHRQHQFEDVAHSVQWANEAGIKHINLDLIFGIPGQTLASWRKTLALASNFQIDHLSLYSLIVEDGTPFKKWYDRGLINEIDDDLVAEMYETAGDFLTKGGFQQYEISNWALNRKDGQDARCQHNLHTWQYHSYYGFGAGASGFIDNNRIINIKPLIAYIQSVQRKKKPWPAAESIVQIDRWEQMQEMMMIGLRLTSEGVSDHIFQQRFNSSMFQIFAKQIQYLQKIYFVERHGNDNEYLRLTRKGRLLGNKVFMEFVGNQKPAGMN